MNRLIFSLFLVVFGVVSSLPTALFALEFNSSRILDDSDLFDYESMDLKAIQNFLEKRNGTLHHYVATDKNGQLKPASEIIFNASQEHKVNPKFILVTLQKEQSLVEDSDPSQKQYDWATGYGVCDSCDMNDPALVKFRGFGKQVDSSAALQRWYVDNANNGWLKVKGGTYPISGQLITIANQATANLYNYTPHLLGNLNFWKIWNRWFSQKYPDGTLLQVGGEPGVWLIKDGTRRPFLNKSALISRFGSQDIIKVSKSELEKYPLGVPIKYPNYSLLVDGQKKVYLLVDDVLRPFESMEVVRTIGYNPEEFEPILDFELSTFTMGKIITLQDSYPMGALLQNNKTGAVFYVESGIKYPIKTRDILKINYPKEKLYSVGEDVLQKLVDGEAVKLKDGNLVKTKNSPTVFVISNGKKQPIQDEKVFNSLGYSWKNILTVSVESLADLALGEVLELDYKN